MNRFTLGRRTVFRTILACTGSLWPWRQDLTAASDLSTNTREMAVVRRFLLSWETRDMTQVLAHLAEGCECRLTQWGPLVRGHSRIASQIAPYVERPRRVDTRIVDMHTAGPLVTCRYVQRYVYENGDLPWEGVGAFLVREDRIEEWRTYTTRVGNTAVRPCSSAALWDESSHTSI